jgi:hypothetical protein
MNHSVGTADRALRAVLGPAVGAADLHYQDWFGLIGLVFLGTTLIGWRPAYLSFCVSTCTIRSEGT